MTPLRPPPYMPFHHDFHDKIIAFAGRFKNTQASFARELEALGAHIKSNNSTKIDYLITGKLPPDQIIARATLIGAVILTEEEARAVMRGEQIDTPELEKGGEQNLDDLLGQARGTLDEPMSPQTWQRLIELLDACHPEQLEPLTHYLEAHLEKWEEPATRQSALRYFANLALRCDERDRAYVEHSLRALSPRHAPSLCVAPAHWVGEMVKGVSFAKHGLVRRLDSRDVQASPKQLATVLAQPDLDGVTQLLFDPDKLIDNALLGILFERPHFDRLTHFAPGRLSAAQARLLRDAADIKIRPRVLGLSGHCEVGRDERRRPHDYSAKIAVPLAHAPMFEEVDTLDITGVDEDLLCFLRESMERDLLPKKRALVWNTFYYYADDFCEVLQYLGPIETVTFTLMFYSKKKYSGWTEYLAAKLPESVHTLDLSLLQYEHGSKWSHTSSLLLFAPNNIVECVCRELSESTLLTHIETLRLGALYYDERIRELFEAYRPDLDVTP